MNFEIMQKQQKLVEQNCLECFKKDKLIEKYLNLIELFKKKSERSILKKSNENVSSNTSHSNLKISKLSLAIVLYKLNFRRITYLFQRLKHVVDGPKYQSQYAFAHIIQSFVIKHANFNMKALFQVWKKTNFKINCEQFNQNGKNKVLLEQQVSNLLQSHKLKSDKKDNIKQLTKKVFELTQQLAQLSFNNKLLERQVQENKRRQDMESKKKQSSMQNFAEEVAEKNEIIAELQAALTFYETKQGKGENNVLEEDSLTVKKQVEKLQKINDKIHFQLERKGQQLIKNQQQLRYYQGKARQLELEIIKLREQNFEMGVEISDIQKKKQYWNNMSLFLEKKLIHLKKYQKTICNNLRVIEQCSLSDNNSFNSSMKARNSAYLLEDVIISLKNAEEKDSQHKDFNTITRFQNEYKVQKILNYLYNIELEDSWMNNEERLFDNEQFSVLNDVKVKFMALHKQLQQLKGKKQKYEQVVKSIKDGPARTSKNCNEGDQIYFNEQHVEGSIFDIFASNKGLNEKPEPYTQKINSKKQICQRCIRDQSRQITTRRSEPGFTIKLLEMELQKNKQVEKISELKNKLFHIRSMVMNFIKALDIKNLKPEARDIMEIFFQLFEYSEEEKEIILKLKDTNQKRFFGIF